MTGEWRHLTAEERHLVTTLVGLAGLELLAQRGSVDQIRVCPMDDGGMGSLRFEQATPSQTYSNEVAQVTFRDSDGVEVLASLSLNASGELDELDMFKGDFSPLDRIADSFEPFPPGPKATTGE